MATVRGMTPEAIRALLKKEIGDYQALSIAVNSAKGASESAIAEVEKIRDDIANMEINFDDSKLAEALEKFESDMDGLNKSLDEVAEAAIVRENKLTALELALNQDRSKFDREMRDMAQQLVDSKTQLEQDLAEAAERLAQNVVEVGDKLSAELDTANKTLNESLAKDLDKLNADLTAAFGDDLQSLESRQNAKTDALDQELKGYKFNTDAKMSTLLSDIDKAKAYAEGFLQPGNLVWNPRALDNARHITPSNSGVTLESLQSGGRNGVGALQVTNTVSGTTYIDYGALSKSTFAMKNGSVFEFSVWVKPTANLPAKSIGLKLGYSLDVTYNQTELPANVWTQIVGELTYSKSPDQASYFSIRIDPPFPVQASAIFSDPHLKAKVTSDLIVNGAVTSESIATGAIVAGKIAADAITSNNILAGSIAADRLVAKSISADQLASYAVTADKIAANAVNADKIKAKSIGVDQLASYAVTADKIAANAVNADKIDANAVTAQKLAAGAVTADKIAANSVDATKLTVMPGNLFPDPYFRDSCWGDSGQVYAHTNNGGELRFYPVNAQNGRYYQPSGLTDKSMMLEKGAAYRITANVWANNSIQKGVTIDIYVRYLDPTGKTAIRLCGSIPVTVGTSIESIVLTAPDNMSRSECTIGFFVNKPWTGGQISLWQVHMTRAADASLIVKGGVQADHIASESINTGHMSADSIDGDRIKTNTLDAGKIRAKSLTSDHVTFKDGFIQNAMIADAEITSGKIKSLGANQITTGTMHGDRIQANTLNGDRIRSNTLDASAIKTGTLDASQIATGTLNADRIAADSITVTQLRAGTIVPIGGSLILSEPKVSGGVPEPIWWQACDSELAEDYNGWPRPDGNPWRLCSTAQSVRKSISPPKRLVKVQPGQKYRLQFWCRSTKVGTKMFIEMRDQKGSHAVKSGAVSGTVNNGDYKTAAQAKESWDVTDFTKSKVGTYLVSNFTPPTVITKVTSTIEFKEDVEYVYLAAFHFNHDNGTDKGNQWIAGLTLELDIPDQAEIDARQDSDAQFLRGVIENMARMLVRAENVKPDFDFVRKGFTGTVAYDMMGVRVFDDAVTLYIDPDWRGSVVVLANVSRSTTLLGITGCTTVHSDTFTTHTDATIPAAFKPPNNFKYNGSFRYMHVDPRPGSLGVIDNVVLLIRHKPTFEEMFTMLSTKIVPTTGLLTYGRNASEPNPPLIAIPPWEYNLGSSR